MTSIAMASAAVPLHSCTSVGATAAECRYNILSSWFVGLMDVNTGELARLRGISAYL